MMDDSNIEVSSENSKTDEHFINKLNDQLTSIFKQSVYKLQGISIDINDLYSNSPVMSASNSDEENDCFDEMNEYSPKNYRKLSYDDVKRSLDKYYETEDKYSDELDLLIAYLNGQKNLYIQAKQLTQLKLNLLMFPSIIGSTSITFFAPFITVYYWSGIFIAAINALITVCVSLIHYLKLQALIDLYLQLVNQYDKLENSLQMTISKLYFLEDKQQKSEIILNKIQEFETKMNEIKETNTVLIPGELISVFSIIYHIHIFSFIKKMRVVFL